MPMTDDRPQSGPLTTREPSRGYRWLVLLAMSVAVYGSYYAFDYIGPLAPLLSRQLGFSDSEIGLLQAIFSLPNIFMVLIGGAIVDRVGTRKSIMLFGTITFVGLVVTALTPRLLVMAAGRLIVGVGAESLAIAVMTGIARWFRGRELSLGNGVNATIMRFGSLSAQTSPAWAAGAYAYWQWPLYLSVAFGGFCLIGPLLYWVLDRRASRHYQLGDPEPARPNESTPRAAFTFNRSFWLIVMMCVAFYCGIFPFQTFAQKFMIEAKGASPRDAALLVGMLPFFCMVGTPLFGHLVDRVARRSLFMMAGALLLVPVYLLMAYSSLPLWIPTAMMGVAFALVPAVMWPSVAYVVPVGRLGFAFGVMDAVQQAGLFGFNLLIGWSNDRWSAGVAHPAGYYPGMWLFSGAALAAVLFAIWLRRVEAGPCGHGLDTITAGAS